jgi:hypothetical protein
VITQRHQAQFAATELTPQIPLHTGQIVRFGGDMEGIDHHLGRLIRWQRRQQLSPQLPPALTRQQVVLQLGPTGSLISVLMAAIRAARLW